MHLHRSKTRKNRRYPTPCRIAAAQSESSTDRCWDGYQVEHDEHEQSLPPRLARSAHRWWRELLLASLSRILNGATLRYSRPTFDVEWLRTVPKLTFQNTHRHPFLSGQIKLVPRYLRPKPGAEAMSVEQSSSSRP